MGRVLTLCVVCCLALALGGCAGSSTSSSAASSAAQSSSSSASSQSTTLDASKTIGKVSFSVSSSWKERDDQSDSSTTKQTYTIANSGSDQRIITVAVGPASASSSMDEVIAKAKSSWIDYQGGTGWSASKVGTATVGSSTVDVYECSWTLRTGTAAHQREVLASTGDGYVELNYFYTTGDASPFDQVLATVKIG